MNEIKVGASTSDLLTYNTLYRDVIDSARETAAIEAQYFPQQLQEEKAREILKKKKYRTVKRVKEKVEESRRIKMRTVEQYLCDYCDKVIPITKENVVPEGFVVKGNIYVADPSFLGGLVGNNFPKVEQNEKIELGSVKETVFCRECMLKALGISPRTEKAPDWRRESTKTKKPQQIIEDTIRADRSLRELIEGGVVPSRSDEDVPF